MLSFPLSLLCNISITLITWFYSCNSNFLLNINCYVISRTASQCNMVIHIERWQNRIQYQSHTTLTHSDMVILCWNTIWKCRCIADRRAIQQDDNQNALRLSRSSDYFTRLINELGHVVLVAHAHATARLPFANERWTYLWSWDTTGCVGHERSRKRKRLLIMRRGHMGAYVVRLCVRMCDCPGWGYGSSPNTSAIES